MRVYLSVLIVLSLTLGLVACGGGEGNRVLGVPRPAAVALPAVDQSNVNLGTVGSVTVANTTSLRAGAYVVAAAEGPSVSPCGTVVTLSAPARTYAAGEVVVCAAPTAFLGRIDTVTQIGGSAERILDISPIALSEVIDSGSFSFTATPDWSTTSQAGQLDNFNSYFSSGSRLDFFYFPALSFNYNAYRAPFFTACSIMDQAVTQADYPTEFTVTEAPVWGGEVIVRYSDAQIGMTPTVRGDFTFSNGGGLDSATIDWDAVIDLCFNVSVTIPTSIEMSATRQVFEQTFSYPVEIPGTVPISASIDLTIPASIYVDAKRSGESTFRITTRYALAVRSSFDGTSFTSTHTLNKIVTDDAAVIPYTGDCVVEMDIDPRCDVSFFCREGPYLDVNSSVDVDLHNPSYPAGDEMTVNATATAGLAGPLAVLELGLTNRSSSSIGLHSEGFDYNNGTGTLPTGVLKGLVVDAVTPTSPVVGATIDATRVSDAGLAGNTTSDALGEYSLTLTSKIETYNLAYAATGYHSTAMYNQDVYEDRVWYL